MIVSKLVDIHREAIKCAQNMYLMRIYPDKLEYRGPEGVKCSPGDRLTCLARLSQNALELIQDPPKRTKIPLNQGDIIILHVTGDIGV